MIKKGSYPVLDFDDDKDSVVNPFKWEIGKFKTNKLIITFFPDVMEKLKKEGLIELDTHFAGENPVDIFHFTNQVQALLGQQMRCSVKQKASLKSEKRKGQKS